MSYYMWSPYYGNKPMAGTVYIFIMINSHILLGSFPSPYSSAHSFTKQLTCLFPVSLTSQQIPWKQWELGLLLLLLLLFLLVLVLLAFSVEHGKDQEFGNDPWYMRACKVTSVMGCRAPLSTGFSREEYWSGLPCPPPWDLPNPHLSFLQHSQAGSLPLTPSGKPQLLQY